MPTIARDGPYRLFFFSADCAEPAHVHVQRERLVAKIWLHDARIASRGGYPAAELARIVDLVRTGQESLLERWHEHCNR